MQAVTANGGSADSTVGQFLDHWQAAYQQKQVAAPVGGSASPGDAKPFAIGDSIALGAQQANGYAGGGAKSAHPDDILTNINAIPLTGAGSIPRGTPVVLSSGMSNSPDSAQLATVQQQLDSLHARGVTDIRLLGVGTRSDFVTAGLNDKLAALAQQNPGVTFVPIQSGGDQVHPTAAGYRNLGSLPQQLAGAATTNGGMSAAPPPDPRAAFPQMLNEANSTLDRFGADSPVYQAGVASMIRAKQRMYDYSQAQFQRVNQETLIGAAIGLPPAGTPPPAPPPPGSQPVDPDVTSPTTAQPATPMDKVNTTSAGLTQPAPARPTSLNALLSTPAMQQAWSNATPEAQWSVMAILEHNAQGQDPPVTPAAQGLYYQLSGQAVNDPATFQGIDLSDPKYTGVLPHA